MRVTDAVRAGLAVGAVVVAVGCDEGVPASALDAPSGDDASGDVTRVDGALASDAASGIDVLDAADSRTDDVADDVRADAPALDGPALDDALSTDAPDAADRRDAGSGEDPSVAGYRARADVILEGNLAALDAWAAANASVADNANPGRLSMWTAAAGFSRAATRPATLAAARKLAAAILEDRVVDLFAGGNDGWPAWATADTRVRHAALIQSDPARYAPTGFPANPDSADGRYSLDDLFRIVLTRSFYAPIDSTSNHYLMNATARLLAEMAYPGQVARAFNDNPADPMGAEHILARAKGLAALGPGEYGSPNYGADNWGEFLSVMQLTRPSTPRLAEVQRAAAVAYGIALADMGAFWMNGNLAMPTGRGYPSTGAWGVAAGDVLTWVYFGGDFGNTNLAATVTDTGEKTLGVLRAEGLLAGFTPPVGTLHLADPVPRVSQAEFGDNHQYAYLTATYGHSCESYKFGAHGGWQTHWNSRVVWTKPYAHTYQATAWIANVAVNATTVGGVTTPTLDSNGNPQSVDPVTLQPFPLYGSGTYGVSVFEDFTQHQDTVLHVYNIPPHAIAGNAGGTMPTRGALIYLPIPRVRDAAGRWITAPSDYLAPQVSSDRRRLFVGYSGVFLSFNASAPIANPRPTDTFFDRGAQFFRVYGGPEADTPVAADAYIQFAVAVQTSSPERHPGATLAERFAHFRAAMEALPAPTMAVVDRLHPVWRFSDGDVTLSNTYQGDRYHGGNDGLGQDWIGGPRNENPMVIDYAAWPMLRERVLSTGVTLLDQPQGGDLTVSMPGAPTAFYDVSRATLTEGANVGLTVVPDAAGAARLAWSTDLGQTGFRVERSRDGLAWMTVPAASALSASVPGFVDTGLVEGAAYLYRVTALGTASGVSAPASVVARFAAPGELGLTVTAADTVRLAWTNRAVGATNTRIEYAADGSEQWITLDTRPPTQNTYTVTRLASGTRRFFRVRAVSAGGTSVPSNRVGTEVGAATVGTTVSMPAYLTAESAAGRVSLQWTNTSPTATAWRIERAPAESSTWTVLTTALAPTATRYDDGTVAPRSRYVYRVAAVAGASRSAYSNTAACATP